MKMNSTTQNFQNHQFYPEPENQQEFSQESEQEDALSEDEQLNQQPKNYTNKQAVNDSQSREKQQNSNTQQFKQNTQNDTYVKPSKQVNEMNPLDRLKYMQSQFKQNWHGILTEFTGRPGTSLLCNKKRSFQTTDQYIYEGQRSDTLNLILQLVNTLEQEGGCLTINQNNMKERPKQIKSNFHKSRQFSDFEIILPISQYIDLAKSQGDYLFFKPIQMSQLLNNTPPTMNYQRNHPINCTDLLYKILKGDTKLVRSMLEANGFSYTESHDWNILWSSSSCKAYLYEGLNEYQKINHFPSSYEITRKDRLCFNIMKMQEKFGKENFDIVPDTYILPNEYNEFHAHFTQISKTQPKKNVWIVKPANLSRGRGIYLIDNINEVCIDELSVISRYVSNPLLINGHKFDLRIYVLVSCYDPLKIYVYKEGLARFASESYSNNMSKDNKFMHLTNYSINKKNDNFVYNDNQEQDDVGFKWSLSAFCKHLEQAGIDMSLLWSRIFDVIIKSILSGEHYVNAALKKNGLHRNNCFEIFGYDILLDSDLKPWLVEVNLSPSLATESPLDLTIKANLLADTFNLLGVKRFDRKKESMKKMQHRSKVKSSNTSSTMNPMLNPSPTSVDCFLNQHIVNPAVIDLIDNITMEDQDFQGLEENIQKVCLLKNREIIAETVGEFCRKGNFVRIYPCKNSSIYDQYFAAKRPINKIIHKVLYSDILLPYMKNFAKQSNSDVPKMITQSSEQIKAELKRQIQKEEQKNSETESIYKQNQESKAKQIIQQEITKPRMYQQEETQNQPPVLIQQEQKKEKSDKVVITGDDILIEYVTRIAKNMKNSQSITDSQYINIEKFICHSVWHVNDQDEVNLISRMQNRLNEMLDRRRRLIRYMFKKEGKLDEFDMNFQDAITRKNSVIQKFSSKQLEDLLRSSTKNVALEIVSSLIPPQGGDGILLQLEQKIQSQPQQVFSQTQWMQSIQKETENRMSQNHQLRERASPRNKPLIPRLNESSMNKSPSRGDISDQLLQKKILNMSQEFTKHQEKQRLFAKVDKAQYQQMKSNLYAK